MPLPQKLGFPLRRTKFLDDVNAQISEVTHAAYKAGVDAGQVFAAGSSNFHPDQAPAAWRARALKNLVNPERETVIRAFALGFLDGAWEETSESPRWPA